MDERAMTFFQLIIDSVWKIATGWRLPGLNFTFARFLWFLLVFSLVIYTVNSILSHRLDSPFDTSAPSFEEYYAEADRKYREALKGYWERRDADYL